MNEEAEAVRPFVVSKPDGTESSILVAKHARDAATQVFQRTEWDACAVFDVGRGKRFRRQAVAVADK